MTLEERGTGLDPLQLDGKVDPAGQWAVQGVTQPFHIQLEGPDGGH